jgi:hypothetical protein
MESVRDRSLATFRLSPTLKHYLLNAGFRTVGDLENMGPIELSKGHEIKQKNHFSFI